MSAGKANGDVLRVLRAVQLRTRSTYSHLHVKGHQDSIRRYADLSFEAKMNTECDRWAKEAIINYVFSDFHGSIGSIDRDLQILPLESARVFLGGVKQTTDIAKGLRASRGRERAKAFYAKEGVFDNRTFDSIDFDAIQSVLKSKPQMYNLWYGKQCSGFCGTGY